MDFRHPLSVVTPTLDGDVLAVLAGADEEFSGRRLHSLVTGGSENGVRNAAERLVDQGIVLRREAGKAKLYRLNRLHVSAEAIERLAQARLWLVTGLREAIARWEVAPRCAALFGSVARKQAGPDSDLDLLVVRPQEIEEGSEPWENQLSSLARLASACTGNDAQILELGAGELDQAQPLLKEVLEDGIELSGSLNALRDAIVSDGR